MKAGQLHSFAADQQLSEKPNSAALVNTMVRAGNCSGANPMIGSRMATLTGTANALCEHSEAMLAQHDAALR